MKNKDYISWNKYFMEIAKLAARRSKDPDVQVGCCIVEEDEHHILSTGYNGLPYGMNDETFNWEKSSNLASDKSSYVVHAEANAILNSTRSDLRGTIVYVTLFPCNECAKLLAQKRIKKLIYLNDDPKHAERMNVSKFILESAGIIVEKFNDDINL